MINHLRFLQNNENIKQAQQKNNYETKNIWKSIYPKWQFTEKLKILIMLLRHDHTDILWSNIGREANTILYYKVKIYYNL